MNIVIIEDELLTAEDLTEIINGLDETILLKAVLHSVKDAISYFGLNPFTDLIFSDIQLGDGLSFEIFRTVNVRAPIIYCTAYDEYALEAIKSHGIEYILKPYTAEMIVDAIGKYHSLKKNMLQTAPDYEKLIRSISGEDLSVRQPSSILVYYKDKVVPVGFDEIAIFYIDGEFTRLHCFNGRNYIINESLDELEQLGKTGFFRINRQTLVSRRAVVDANTYSNRKYVVNLSIPFKDTLVVSKNRTGSFLQWLTKQ